MTLVTHRPGATTRNMRNDELKEFRDTIVKTLRIAADGRRTNARFSAEAAHDCEGLARAKWETLCARNKRIACAYEQAAALIEAAIK